MMQEYNSEAILSEPRKRGRPRKERLDVPKKSPGPRGPRRDGKTIVIETWLRENPASKYADVAEQFGISRERIRQIAERAMLPKKRPGIEDGPFSRTCSTCGTVEEVITPQEARQGQCLQCKPTGRRKSPAIEATCAVCGKQYQLEGRQRSMRIQYLKRSRNNPKNICSACFAGNRSSWAGRRKEPSPDA